MQTRLRFTFRSTVDSFLRTVPRQPRQLRYSTTNQLSNRKPAMDQIEHHTDAHRRPKKLICKSTLHTKPIPQHKDPPHPPPPIHTNLKLTLQTPVAPGDIAPTSNEPTPEPQPQAIPAPTTTLEALRTSTSTPNSTTETEVLSHAARAHQFGTNPPLTISQIHGTNPLHQFNTWFRDPRLPASSAPETCTLSTASLPSGRVSARVVYLKELDERGWVVYSNWGSREGKGGQVFGGESGDTLEAMPEPDSEQATITAEVGSGNKWGALTFSWASVERQSRVLWAAEPEQMEVNQRRKSVVSLQGDGDRVVPLDIELTDVEDGRALLEAKVKEMEERFAGVEDIPLPPFWGGVRLVPESVEFWQGRRSRLHDRFRYVRVEGQGEDAKWRVQRLSP
ncbi:hypothetical protein HAV15_003750 [Penicillium sp. str. |nr:hypothetical protein HAV15_003750 [Penicillium sp. str. \